MQAMALGKTCRLLPSDALHASVMKSNKTFNIATRDPDFPQLSQGVLAHPLNQKKIKPAQNLSVY
jgi:predicted nucleic acid-binding protein